MFLGEAAGLGKLLAFSRGHQHTSTCKQASHVRVKLTAPSNALFRQRKSRWYIALKVASQPHNAMSCHHKPVQNFEKKKRREFGHQDGRDAAMYHQMLNPHPCQPYYSCLEALGDCPAVVLITLSRLYDLVNIEIPPDTHQCD